MRRLLAAALLCLPFVASAQTVTQSASKVALIFSSNSLQGNGADTTEDNLATYVGTVFLANVGDLIHFNARGVAAASTDTKSIRVKLGASSACSVSNTAVGNTTWIMDCWIMKTGSSAQAAWFQANNATNNTTQNYGTLAITDTSPITLQITAQNATAGTANSIQIQGGFAQYFPAQ